MAKPATLIMTSSTVACFLLLFTSLDLSFVSCSESESRITYSDHCASTVPESSAKELVSRDDFPHDGKIAGFFTGGSGILNHTSSFSYQSQSLRTTDMPDLFYLEGGLTFEGVGYERSYYYDGGSRRKVSYFQSQLRFGLSGFWLKSNGQLCMVGSASTYSKEGKELNLAVVLKLSNFKNSTDFPSLIKGTLTSLSNSKNDMAYFETVTLLIFPQMNAKSSKLFSDNFDVSAPPSGSDIPPGLPLSSLSKNRVCDLLPYKYYAFDLKYTKRCLSGKNCAKDLPLSLSLTYVQCSKDEKGLLLLIEFQNSSHYRMYNRYIFSPNMTWLGEGTWDESKNQLVIVACRLSGLDKESFSNVHVGDCSLRLSLQYPAIISIRKLKRVVGQIWSTKSVGETDDFDMARLEGSDSYFRYRESGLKYKYTKIDRVLKSCPEEKHVGNGSGRSYPDPYSLDMRFDMSVQISGKKSGWAYLDPFSVGDRLHSPISSFGNPTSKIKVSRFSRFNMSCTIRISPCSQMNKMFGGFNLSHVVIFAEGVYDSETGNLCMIGCRNMAPKNQIPEEDSMDCEILVKFQFPEANSKTNGRYINGSIESTRKTSDPLFFERMELISAAFDRIEAEEYLRLIDVEVILALLSTSLASVFVAFQIFHVKKKPEVLPFISISMLLLLTLGYMIPLVLNFEALFFPKNNAWNFLRRNIAGLEVEVIVRLVILVAFLLQCRLLQLSWSARSGKENRKEAWRAETAAMLTTAALHVGGIILTNLLVKYVKDRYEIVADDNQRNSLATSLATSWRNLECYSGLVLDGFLLPQILINLFGHWKRKSLSPTFYLGITTINLLPHAYHLYKHHNHARNLESIYIYASPDVEFFSAAWDIIIPLGCLLLALTIFLQQKFGGRFMLPQKFRASEGYEKIPSMVSEVEASCRQACD